MALRFTDNSTTNVDVGSGANIDSLAASTVLAWGVVSALPTAQGTIWQKGAANPARHYASITSAGRFLCLRDRGTTDMTTNAILTNFAVYGTGKWLCFVAVFPSSTTATDAKLLIGDLSTPAAEPSAYVTQTAGSGAAGGNAAENAYLGNKDNAGALLAWPGDLAVMAVFGATLTNAEAQSLQLLPRPVVGGTRALAFLELGLTGTGTQLDLTFNGNNGTITGATQVAHHPRGSWRAHLSSWS